MTVQGINLANQSSIFMPSSGSDPESKALQKEIETKQKELKELSQKDDIPLEEKVKQKQKLQQEINQLETQLRMHQQEVRQQKQQESAMQGSISSENGRQSLAASMSLSSEGTLMSGMESLLSAHSSLRQARTLQGVSQSQSANARVLESEIEQDKGLGMGVERKEKQLDELKQRIDDTMAMAASSLKEANQTVAKAKDDEGQQGEKGEEITNLAGDNKAEKTKSLAEEDKRAKKEDNTKQSEE